jgi:23S rRNA (pseudouridine1915-N3)-methyltransferase
VGARPIGSAARELIARGMKLLVAAVGRLKRGPERDLAERYRERAATLGRSLGIRGLEIVEIEEGRARRGPDRASEEAAALAKFLPENAAIVVLDEHGKAYSSLEMAGVIGQWRDHGTETAVFVIGGADGLAAGLQKRAAVRLAFGAATWPHQLVRIMLLEQLYRAVTILAGHPYHRE